MMRLLRWIFPVAAALSLGCATPIEQSRWIRVQSAHFELISGAGGSDSIEIAQRLELLRGVLDLCLVAGMDEGPSVYQTRGVFAL